MLLKIFSAHSKKIHHCVKSSKRFLETTCKTNDFRRKNQSISHVLKWTHGVRKHILQKQNVFMYFYKKQQKRTAVTSYIHIYEQM
jgi:hypothetical protein